MAGLRAMTRFSAKAPALMPVQTIRLNSSISTFCRTPKRCVMQQLMPSLGAHPARSPERNFVTVIQDYERGVIFRFGKHSGEKEPGLRWSFPILNEVRKVDMRTRTMQIPSQELMTKDNVTIHVDAVAFYKVSDPLKALCNIKDCNRAASEAAQTSVRDQLSRAAFDEVLHERDEAGRNVLAALCKLTADWGVIVEAVKLKNIRVDVSMIRAMGRVAEAERVREARMIEAVAEHDASLKLVQAAREFGKAPLGLRLRELQTYTQIAAEKNTVLVPSNLEASVAQALVTLHRDVRMRNDRGKYDGGNDDGGNVDGGNDDEGNDDGGKGDTGKDHGTNVSIGMRGRTNGREDK